jgi:hypothetical protein
MKHTSLRKKRGRSEPILHRSSSQTIDSGQTHAPHADTGVATTDLILSLQHTIGNAAVQRLIGRTSVTHTPIQRHLNFTSGQLGGKADASLFGKFKDNSAFSTFRKLQSLLDDYHGLGPVEVDRQYDVVTEIVVLCEKWLGDLSHLKQSDAQKEQDIRALQKEAVAEKRNLYVAQKVGLPLVLIEGLSPANFNGLYNAVALLERKDTQGGMAAFTAVKPNLGNSAALIEAFLKRNYITQIDPATAAVMDEKYEQINTNASGGPAAISTIKSAAQAKLDRLKALDAQHAAALADMTASKGAKKQADYPILAGTGAIAIEYGKLRLQKAQFESIVNGTAMADKHKKSTFAKLTDAEMAGLVGYTSDLYSTVNNPLRKDIGTSNMAEGSKALIGATASALNKLKPYKGIVYRHADDFTGYAEMHHPGAVVSDTAFLSTAKEQKGCASAAENHGVLEILISKSGRDVSEASVFGNKEAEILFRPGTKFRVSHVLTRAQPQWGQPHNRAHWAPQNSPKFAEAMSLLETEGALMPGFHRVVYKVEV